MKQDDYKEAEDIASLMGKMPVILFNFLSKDEAKAFWINCYNGYFQLLAHQGVEKPDIFKKDLIFIAKHALSLDDIEHGILRKLRVKAAMGYIKSPFYNDMIKKWAMEEMDPRIHFALNCGAVSCPPIAFYQPEQIQQQLDTATASFLESETTIIDREKEVHISKLFKWYQGDFGGEMGIQRFLLHHEAIQPKHMDYKIRYKEYSWEQKLRNFR